MTSLGHVIHIAILLVVQGCHQSNQPTLDKKNQTVTGIQKITEPTVKDKPVIKLGEDKTALVVIMGSGFFSASPSFNLWNSQSATKDNVYLLAEEEKTLQEFFGEKHIVPVKNLSQELSTILATIKAKNLLIFLASHGDDNGNLCYDSHNSCNVTEDVIINALHSYATQNKPSLEQIIVIPFSCQNKLLMDSLAVKLGNFTWPFHISYMVQKNIGLCETLVDGNVFFHKIVSHLNIKGLTENHIDQFLKNKTLDQLIDFYNSLLLPNFAQASSYTLHHHQQPAKPLYLKELGYNILLKYPLCTEKMAEFPNHKPIEFFLEQCRLSRRFFPYVKYINFGFEQNIKITIPVNGQTTTIINEPEVAQKLRYASAYISNDNLPGK